ncbi:MAG: hypothetical protein ACKO7B_11305, partial [Flavobacteriales bacterium]
QQLHPERDYRKTLSQLFELAESSVSKGFSGACWGYDFAWASPGKYLPPFAPSGVVTAFMVKGLHRYFLVTGDPRARRLIESAATFVQQDLQRTTDATGIAISYTPFKRDICYNASLLAADILARTYSMTGEEQLLKLSHAASQYVIARQQPDGRWNYSLDESSGREREQVDFHQGYVIDALQSVAELTGSVPAGTAEAVRKGLDFYQ